MKTGLEAKSDSELIDMFVAGSSEAFETLVTRHHARAYNIAYSLLKNSEDAKEVAQDAFVRVHRSLVNFRKDAEFTTWFYSIVQNLSRNKLRYNRRHGQNVNMSIDNPFPFSADSPSEEKKMDLPDQKSNPSNEVSISEMKRMMFKELENLPETQREIFIMRNVQNMSYNEIADVMKCKLGTVKSRLFRVHKELKLRLEELIK